MQTKTSSNRRFYSHTRQYLVQDISQQYIETEKELFNVQRNEFEKQKKLNLFQFIVLLLVIFSLMVVLLLFRRKIRNNKGCYNKKQKSVTICDDDKL
ncbi:MAG: hypothetical protein R2781_07385 [Flavobacteriaceae bacterium]